MSEQRLFISHASEDAAVVGRIVEYLEQRGIPCWVSGRDIPPRAIYAEAITSGINECAACAVIISEAANASAGVKRELELASHNAKPFIPIRIDGVEPGPGLDYYLRNTQWIEYHSERERALDRIIAHVKGGPALAAAKPPRAKQRTSLAPIALGLGALALALGAGYYFFGRTDAPTQIASNDPAPAAAPPAEIIPPVNLDGLWSVNVLCANGSALREPNVVFTQGAYTRQFSGEAEGETKLFIESTGADQIRVTGHVTFVSGETYPLNAAAALDATQRQYTGIGDYGVTTGCPFTAARRES